jgi:hypothetical protein
MKKLFIINCIIFFVACSRVQTNELYGKYVFNGYSNDTIYILQTYEYIHLYNSDNNTICKQTGKWNFDTIAQYLNFYGFNFSNSCESTSSYYWAARVKKKDNYIRIIYASEENLFYQKME